MNQANLIVARIERARQDRDISVAELARRIDVDRKRLWYVLNGQRSMHVDEFVRLCAIMDMSLACFLTKEQASDLAETRRRMAEDIRVYIYDDRMLIQSPGKLPNIVTVDNIRHVRFSRNPILARVFTAFDWVRELNEGVDKIYQEMADAGLPEPEYESQDDYYLKLTLRNDLENRIPRMNAGDVGNRVGNVGNHVGNHLSETEERVLALVKSDSKTSARKISDKLEISVRQAERTLASLRDKGVIVREGGTRGYWKVR